MKRLLALLLAALLVLCALALCSCGDSKTPRKPAITVETILAELQPLSRLTTLKAEISGIVTVTQPGRWIWQETNRMVLIARGYALYGLDVGEADVQLDEGLVRVTLPSPEVVDAWVDVEKSLIWDVEIGRFRRFDPELEEQAWVSALELIREGACEPRLVASAKVQAEHLVTELTHRIAESFHVKIAWDSA